MLWCTEQRLMTKQAAASVVAAQNYHYATTDPQHQCRCHYYRYYCIYRRPAVIVGSAISKLLYRATYTTEHSWMLLCIMFFELCPLFHALSLRSKATDCKWRLLCLERMTNSHKPHKYRRTDTSKTMQRLRCIG